MNLKNKITIKTNETNNNIEIFILKFNFEFEEEYLINPNSNQEQFLKDCEIIIKKLTKRYFNVFLKQQLNYAYHHLNLVKNYSKLKTFYVFKKTNKPDLKSLNKFFNRLSSKIETLKIIRKYNNQTLNDISVILEKDKLLKEFNNLGYFQINKTNTFSLDHGIDSLSFKNKQVELTSLF